ncbi:MAG: alpha/beta hydrolase [Anaerolineae bacterium]
MDETQARDLLQDLGGHGPLLHLAHGNGFPPGSYRRLARALGDDYHLLALPARPLWPGSRPEETPTWRPLADDLAQGLEALGLSGIVGLGHSLGGVLTLWAALASQARGEGLFRALVLVEPVILPPYMLWGLRLLRRLGLQEQQPLVQGALHRQRTWPDRQACFDHYRRKALFAGWSDAALWDYVDSGTVVEDDGGSVRLRYPPEWEAHIFATVPVDVWRDVSGLRVPVLFLRGGTSETFRPGAQARLARLLPHAETATVAGAGHLLPMEKPEETAAAIRAFLK